MKTLFLVTLAATGLLHAQEPAAKPAEKEKGGAPLRLIALGEPPPFRQEVRGDRRVEVEAEAGALPPREVGIADTLVVSLALGQIGAPIMAPSVNTLDLRDKSSTWAKLVVPDALLTKPKLALFWRDAGKSWDAPHSMVLADGPEAFPAGQVRFINLLPAAAVMRMGDQTHEIPAGQIWLCRAPAKEETLQISFRASDGSWVQVHTATLEPAMSGTRVQVILYRTDTSTARRPAKALVMREPVAATSSVLAAAGR